MLAVFTNAITVLIGSLIGLLFNKKISDSLKVSLMNAMGLISIIIGLLSALKTNNSIVLILSISIGTIIGELLKIDDALNKFGNYIEKKFQNPEAKTSFSSAWVNSTLLFCIGAMSIVGSFEAGLNQNYTTLFTKSAIDSIAAMILASTLGIGVAFSAISIIIYQGFFTLLASSIKDYLSLAIITELSASGGLLILAIGLNLLKVTKIKIANMLPAIFLPILFLSFFN